MASLSIQLNNLVVGPKTLASEKISASQQKAAELCLSKIISKHIPDCREAVFKIRFEEGRPTLTLNGRAIPLEESPELKKLGRIVKFYEHTGHFSKTAIDPQVGELRKDATHQTVEAMGKASIPGTNGQILAGMRIADDTLSVVRNIMKAVPGINSNDAISSHLGYYAGMFWSFFSFRELEGGYRDLTQAKLIGDEEGKRRAEMRVLSGSICSTASLSYLGGKICDTVSAADVASVATGAADLLFGVGSVLAMGSCILGAARCYRFNDRLNEYLNHPKLTEVERLSGALHFLKDAVHVTPEEHAQLLAQIEKDHPDWTQAKRDEYLKEKVIDLTETKVKYLKRRTSNKSLALILNQADSLLAKLANPVTCKEGIKEARGVLETIQGENNAKMTLFIFGFIAAFISFAAMLISTFLTGGVLPFVLYGVAGVIYLGMSLYSLSGILTKNREIKGGELLPLQDLSHTQQITI